MKDLIERTPFQVKVDEIAEHLKSSGFYHDANKTQNDTSYAYLSHNDLNLSHIGLYFDSYRKKINVSFTCDSNKLFKDYTISRYLPEHLKHFSISMSHEKDSKKCAQDILKRIVPHFSEYNDVVLEVKGRQDSFNNTRASIEQDIETLKKSVGKLWKYGKGKNDSYNKRYVEISKDYGSVKIETSRLSVKTLIKIVQLIDADLYKA